MEERSELGSDRKRAQMTMTVLAGEGRIPKERIGHREIGKMTKKMKRIVRSRVQENQSLQSLINHL